MRRLAHTKLFDIRSLDEVQTVLVRVVRSLYNRTTPTYSMTSLLRVNHRHREEQTDVIRQFVEKRHRNWYVNLRNQLTEVSC